ncbi:rhodanese-like domain-containing protein [Saccharopolyspora mangrovi]|uniref:Rhodanese-like domain-containing protein n=1 Tax=Saccharopolyspora mangrovi TaxID=3082379 RepID=A0ABU6AEU4_9PSEU|nr:rhodanese-like domain-containing protein [Saccharopolyspora sp. S2-29]MEB3369840.1 rhodanese-like domain-containing protein [Saccharopolyspora sp. S2-29]
MTPSLPAHVDPARLRERRGDARIRLIDVRTPGEFAAAHIPGSHNVPLDLLRERHADLTAHHEDAVVLICASGNRAEQARTLLKNGGWERLSVLRGGITSWEGEGGELERGRGAWAMERQVRLAAGLLVLIGVLASTRHEKVKWLAGFVGGGLTFAALTDTCAMARLLSLLPHNRTPRTNPTAQLAALTAAG